MNSLYIRQYPPQYYSIFINLSSTNLIASHLIIFVNTNIMKGAYWLYVSVLIGYCMGRQMPLMKQECQQILDGISDGQRVEDQENIMEDIDKLVENGCTIRLVPFYKWAQNMSHIFVEISFLTTTQTTPCDHILHRQYSAAYDQINVRVLCLHQKTYIVDYRLHVTTFKALNFNYAHWSLQGQNSIVLECLKSPTPYFWPILHSRERTPERKPRIWWQILQKYQKSMTSVIDKLQLEENQVDYTEQIKKKRKHEEADDDIQFYCNQGSPLELGSWL